MLNFCRKSVVRAFVVVSQFCCARSPADQVEASETMLVIADSKSSDYCIVVPATASEAERWAGRELQKYVQKMTGVELPFVQSRSSGNATPAILLAPSSEILGAVPGNSAATLGEEEFKIFVKGKDVYITGGRPRGVMYGVYDLLETAWGCRWLTPDCEVVPNYEKLTLPADFMATDKPALEYRDVLFREAFNPIWVARNRVPGAAYEFRQSLVDKGGRCGIWPLCHGMEYIAPFKKCQGEDQDLLAQKLDGGVEHRANCFSNPKLYDMAKDVVRQWLETHPDAKAYDISQRDGSPDGCHCQACQTRIDAEGSQIAPILSMANRLARDMKAELAGRFLTVVAYNYSVKAPRTLRAEPNVVVRLCLRPTMTSPTEEDYENLKQWLAKTNRLWLWFYCSDYHNIWVPLPNIKSYAEHIRHLAKLGVRGVMAQGLVNGGGDLPALKAWVWAKIMWNPDADIDQLIDTFLQGYYGRSAAAIRHYVNLMDKASRRSGDDFIGSSFWQKNSLSYLNKQTLRQADEFLAQAYSLAENDIIRKRAKVAGFCVRYARMMNEISPQAQLVDGKYGFQMNAKIAQEWQEWFSEVKAAGYGHGAEFEPIEKLENRIMLASKDYETATIQSQTFEAVIVPELSGRVVSLRRLPDGANLLHLGGLSKAMPYDAGVNETFARHAVHKLGDTNIYKIETLDKSAAVLSTTLSNGEVITKTISLNDELPGLKVDIVVANPTSASLPVQRLHIQIHPSRDAHATREIGYKHSHDDAWQTFQVEANKQDILLGQHSPVVKSNDGWIIKRAIGPELWVKPTADALDMSLTSAAHGLRFFRVGLGGWVARPGGPVKLGYVIKLTAD